MPLNLRKQLTENDLRLEIPITDIPQRYMDSVASGLKNYLVPIVGQSGSIASPVLRPIGSGTLVHANGAYHVLTAAHVWHRTEEFERIHFVLTDRAPTGFSISPENISVREVWGGKESEWGPDLALLEIAPNDVSTIGARKSFLNLPQQKTALSEYPPKIEKGLWAITGLVEEFSEVQRKTKDRIITANANCQAFFSTIHDTHEREGYDFFDVGVSKKLDGVPVSFGGMSGGGLWQVDISKDKAGNAFWNGKRYFRGVAFWESEPADGRQIIRFHGPRSIFEMAWEAWKF